MGMNQLHELLNQVPGVSNVEYWSCQTAEFHFRFLDQSGQTHIGIKSHFDRWANSTDFVLYKLPESVFEMEALILAAQRLLNTGNLDIGMGQELDLGGTYRKAKQVLKSANKCKKEAERLALITEFVGEKKNSRKKAARADHRMRSMPTGMKF